LTNWANYLRVGLVAVMVSLLWFWRFETSLPKGLKAGQKVRITGVLSAETQVLGNLQKFALAGVKVRTSRFPEYHWGDRLVVTGQVKIGKQNWLLTEYLLEWPKIEEVSPTFRISPITSFREKLVNIYRQNLPEPYASLLGGIVLGEKSSLPQDFYQALKKTGTMHLVVASGANIAFFAGHLMFFLPFLINRRLSYILTITAIWFYVLLAGGEAPVLRAGIMGTIGYFGLSLGREKESLVALLLAGLILLLLWPRSLFDLGFQLSFAATAGIILLAGRKWGMAEKLPAQIRVSLKTTLAAQALTTPIIFLSFGTYPLISPVANLAVFWTIPYLMLFGFLAVAFGLLLPFLGRALALLSFPLLFYFVKVIELLQNL